MMSLMNLLSGILTLDFPLIYLVRDHIMDEAEAKSGQQFERVVAQFKRKHTTTTGTITTRQPQEQPQGLIKMACSTLRLKCPTLLTNRK